MKSRGNIYTVYLKIDIRKWRKRERWTEGERNECKEWRERWGQ